MAAVMTDSWVWLTRILCMLAVLGSAAACRTAEGKVLPAEESAHSRELAVWLEMPADVPAGDTVSIKLKVRNTADHPVDLPLGGRPAHDIVVTRPDGTEVWRWLHGQIVEDILELRPLQPGEELTFAAEWEQVDSDGNRVPPGTYVVRGILNAEPGQELETEPKTLIITP